MTKEIPQNIDIILGYLRGGGEIDTSKLAMENPEILARCITYLLTGKYHRQNTIRAIIDLLNNSPTVYKGIAWQMLQRIPFSFILELFRVLKKGDNTKRLRHAIACKLAVIDKNQLIRAYFIRPNAFRRLFLNLYLPRETYKDEEIINERYKMAYKLSTLSFNEALEEFGIDKSFLVKTLGLPLEQVMELVETPEEAKDIARITKSDSFFHHSRWFKGKLELQEYEEIAIKKVDSVKNPISFLSIKDHLVDTDSITPKLLELLEAKAKEAMINLMKKFNLERIALIVDISGSMQIAVKITQNLYEAFSRSSNILDLIAFNERAISVDVDRLNDLRVVGSTSIGSAIVLLKQRIDQRLEKVQKDLKKESRAVKEEMSDKQIPQAIIMVTDLEENTAPYLDVTLKLLKEYNDPPLIILLCGVKRKIPINYSHAIIEVDDFHKGLIMQIMEQIARMTAKVAVKEKAMTEILVKRKPIEEEIGAIELEHRPEETFKKGYLKKILCSKYAKPEEVKEKPVLISPEEVEKVRIETEKRLKEKKDKIEEILRVSNSVKLDMMRQLLDMDEKSFNEEVIQYAEDFGFKIDGDNLVVDQGAKGNFIEKLDKIIEQNELILEYTKKIEDVMDGIDNLENFLINKLGNDFEKIRHIWINYKEGKIGKKGLIKEAAKIIGKKFIKIFL